jgi:lipopolysaccharide export system permease protein
VATDENGYVLNLHDGYLQYVTDDNRFSQVSFNAYTLGLDKLTQPADSGNGLAELNSIALVEKQVADGQWSAEAVELLTKRAAEGLRIIGMCFFVAGLAGFPSGKRMRRGLPLEVTVLLVAFAERIVTAYTPGPAAPFAGAVLMLVAGVGFLFYKLRAHQSLLWAAGRREAPA